MFNTKIPIYLIFIIIAIFSGLFITYKNTKHLNFRVEEKIGLLIYISVGTIFGAKYFTLLTNLKYYDEKANFKEIGLSSYGAIIGIILLLFLFSKQFKKSFKDLIYILLPSIPLMYGIGKIGCFLVGCCYGIEYNGPLSVTYNYSYSAPKGISLFPVQLLESIVFIIIFIYTYDKISKVKSNRQTIGKIFVICGASKFLLDYLRIRHTRLIISVNQIVSIFFILIGVYLIFKVKKKTIKKIFLDNKYCINNK